MMWSRFGVLNLWGAKDFAGGIVVHGTAGFSAIAAAWWLGERQPRRGEDIPHDIPMVLVGTALLWFGWFGFNSGSALHANEVAGVATMNTQISAAVASFCWLCVEWYKTFF